MRLTGSVYYLFGINIFYRFIISAFFKVRKEKKTRKKEERKKERKKERKRSQRGFLSNFY